LAGQYLLNLFFLKKLKYILQLAQHYDNISYVGWLNIYIHKSSSTTGLPGGKTIASLINMGAVSL
jgi:hypothetical protein